MLRRFILTLTVLLIFSTSLAQEPVYGLVDRISPGASKLFLFEIVEADGDEDFFELDQKGRRVWIKGNNNISIATGLNWYLKYHAGIHISWSNPRTYLGELPKVRTPERRSTKLLQRYYLNFKTFSYSTPFWNWNRWEQEIDWMALHGINLPLAINGTATAWRNTLQALGYSDREISQHISGPAYQGWSLRGEIEGVGAVPASYYEQQTLLQNQILRRYREWGMEPVLMGYSGVIPVDADQKLGLKIIKSTGVNGEPVAVIHPEEQRFSEIAEIYYNELSKLYDVANYYAIDPYWYTALPAESDPFKTGENIYAALQKLNPNAVWVQQAWGESPLQLMADAIPVSRMMILDAWSDVNPQWGDKKSQWHRENGFEHHDWLFCMMNDFNGNTGLYGQMQRLIDGFYSAKSDHLGRNMRGVGSTSENIGNNSVMYELLYELPWRDEKFDKKEWISRWSEVRYGRSLPQITEAWQILGNTVYNPPTDRVLRGASESVFSARPSLTVLNITPNGTTKIFYDPAELEKALELFLSVADKLSYSENFLFDIVDIAREVIKNRGYKILAQLLDEFEKENMENFEKLSNNFLDLILLQDRLLSSRKEFLLGDWIESAMRLGKTIDERELYRHAAREILTVWNKKSAVNKSEMRDVAHREWSGLLRDFYYKRWKYFLDQINNTKLLPILTDYSDMEMEWVRDTNPYTNYSTADAIEMAREVYFVISRSQK